jgi:dihydrofolate reductase
MGATRRIMMFNWMTADGYFTAADGNLDWVVSDDEQTKAAVQSMPNADTLLLGRKTYEMFAAFWPHALDDSGTSPDPHHPGKRSPDQHAMAVWMNQATKLVFSRTLKEATWQNSRVVREFDAREIEAMKRQPGKDIMVLGSGSIVSQLTQQRPDRRVSVRRLPGPARQRPVVAARRLEEDEAGARGIQEAPSGNVMLHYARSTATPSP